MKKTIKEQFEKFSFYNEGTNNPLEIHKDDMPKIISQMKKSHVLSSEGIDSMISSAKEKVANKEDDHFYHIYKDLEVNQIKQRLLTKRPHVYYLHNNVWSIGNEKSEVGRQTYIDATDKYRTSYIHPDEAALSAFLGVWVPCTAINEGDRKESLGTKSYDDDTFFSDPIIVGQVGARLESPMDAETWHLYKKNVTQDQDKSNKSLLDEVVEEHLDKTVKKLSLERTQDFYVDDQNLVHGARYVARSYLIHQALFGQVVCNYKKLRNRVVIRLTGLGLGNWLGRADMNVATNLYLTGVMKALESFGEDDLVCIKRIEMCWFRDLTKTEQIETAMEKEMKKKQDKLPPINFIQTGFFEKTQDFDDSNDIFIIQFAWDGMSYLGNEYWLGKHKFGASGDPQAACNSTLPYIAHPDINRAMYLRSGCSSSSTTTTTELPILEQNNSADTNSTAQNNTRYSFVPTKSTESATSPKKKKTSKYTNGILIYDLKYVLPHAKDTLKRIGDEKKSNTDELGALISNWEETCQEIKDTYFPTNGDFYKHKILAINKYKALIGTAKDIIADRKSPLTKHL